MFTETYVFELQREHEDGTEETVNLSFPAGEDMTTHMLLAKKFNDFLTACGYVGHNYTHTPK